MRLAAQVSDGKCIRGVVREMRYTNWHLHLFFTFLRFKIVIQSRALETIFPGQIFPISRNQFVKFRSPPRQIFLIPRKLKRIASQYRFLQNSMETSKFCNLAQNSVTRRKLWSLDMNGNYKKKIRRQTYSRRWIEMTRLWWSHWHEWQRNANTPLWVSSRLSHYVHWTRPVVLCKQKHKEQSAGQLSLLPFLVAGRHMLIHCCELAADCLITG